MYCSKESRNILIFGGYIFITQDTSCFRFIALTKICIKIKELFSDFYYKLGKERKGKTLYLLRVTHLHP